MTTWNPPPLKIEESTPKLGNMFKSDFLTIKKKQEDEDVMELSAPCYASEILQVPTVTEDEKNQDHS